MIKHINTILATLSVSAFYTIGAAYAEDDNHVFTVSGFVAMCEDKDSTLYYACAGYMAGYNEGRNLGTYLAILRSVNPNTAAEANELGNMIVGHCVPEDASNQQLIDVAMSYIGRNPDKINETARFVVWRSFVEAFPCK